MANRVFDNATEFAITSTQKTLTNNTTFANRWSDIVVRALTQSGVFGGRFAEPSDTPPVDTTQIWVDTSATTPVGDEPAIFRYFDTGSMTWLPVSFVDIFPTAALDPANVNITGGSITGITDLAIADGGHGASTGRQGLANMGGAPFDATRTISAASGTIAITDNNALILADASSNNVTINLPAVATAGDRFRVIIKRIDNSGNTVTIDPDGAETIDNAATDTLTVQYEATEYHCDGTQWNITSQMTEQATRVSLQVDSVVQTQPGIYTAIQEDRAGTIRITAAATLSLTAAATLGSDWYVWLKADGGDVTIDPNGAETIDGETTIVIPDGSSVRIICDGSNFITVGLTGASTISGSRVLLFEDTVANITVGNRLRAYQNGSAENLFTATYDEYELDFTFLFDAGQVGFSNREIHAQFLAGGVADGVQYTWVRLPFGGTVASGTTTSDMRLMPDPNWVANAIGTMRLSQMLSASEQSRLSGFGFFPTVASFLSRYDFTGSRNANTAHDGIEFYPPSGTAASGSFQLYGIVN